MKQMKYKISNNGNISCRIIEREATVIAEATTYHYLVLDISGASISKKELSEQAHKRAAICDHLKEVMWRNMHVH